MNRFAINRIRKALFTSFLILCVLSSTLLANAGTKAFADSDSTRVPTNPYPSPSADLTLAKHDLAYAPSPLDNPLKGFAPFYPWETESSFPHSLEWLYVPLNAVMSGKPSRTGMASSFI